MFNRFSCGLPDPQETEPPVISECAQCASPLYAGEEVIEYQGFYFCDGCFLPWLIDNGEVKRVTLGGD